MSKPKPCVIACAVLALDIKHSAQKLGLDLGVKFLEGGLHDRPTLLRQKLQEAIDTISASGKSSRIIIGYGVCGRGSVGIRSGDIPLVIPKVHDCIALFLGGDASYRREFKKYPGTYYLSAGWHEEKTEPLSQRKRTAYYGDEKLNYDELVEKYGENTAKETFRFLNSWQKNYQRAAFIDTGVGKSQKYETYAKKMAGQYHWKFEKIDGDQGLFEKMLLAEKTTEEILVVPVQHAIGFDGVRSSLSAYPIWETEQTQKIESDRTIALNENGTDGTNKQITIGLGIDAGGTYTDAVIYDVARSTLMSKSKALTTKWDFTIGIGRALAGLDAHLLQQSEMVALSTTLATNAIVEGQGQKVGMILMPPYSRLQTGEIPHEPKATISGQLEITGKEIVPLDETEIKQVARRMVADKRVKAFAVSGYAGAINPTHELRVKQILYEATGLSATCGHELSGILNFITRAQTAMLNARIIPKLTKLLQDLETVLVAKGVKVPIVVVKGDGTLMSARMAKERPVETILSGPAASVAGARHLTGLKNALVVDMGGTTTDTAALVDGAVSICDTGSTVNGQKTHVKALDIRTTGLGGDSLIQWEKEQFHIGPRRVAPIAWGGDRYPEFNRTLNYLDHHLDRYVASTRPMQILTLTGFTRNLVLSLQEQQIISLLQKRPFSIDELTRRLGLISGSLLEIRRLEEHYVIQRCGLTLTDLLHVTGQFKRWDQNAAIKYSQLVARLRKTAPSQLCERLLKLGIDRLTLDLLKRQLDKETDPDVLDTCPVCLTLTDNLLSGGNDEYMVRIDFKRPIVGIGAPIHFFLPKAANTLGTRMVLPKDADVANAVGAITSNIVINRQVRIVPDQEGGYLIEGIVGTNHFDKFDEANDFARFELTKMVKRMAQTAGTTSGVMALETRDNMALTTDGSEIFIGRVIEANITGPPDNLSNNHSPTYATKTY